MAVLSDHTGPASLGRAGEGCATVTKWHWKLHLCFSTDYNEVYTDIESKAVDTVHKPSDSDIQVFVAASG